MGTRRDVLAGGAALAAVAAMPAMAAVPSSSSMRPKSPLGSSQTALSQYLRNLRGGNDRNAKIDPVTVVDHVRSLGGGGVQFTVPPGSDLKRLRRQLDRHGMFIQGDIRLIDRPGDDTAAFEQGLKDYKALGADCARTVCFVGRRYETFKTLQEYKDWQANAIGVLDVCVPIADRIGLPLAMENHKDRVVDDQVEVLRKYSSPNLGACIDFGNNIAMCDNPVDVVTKLAPFAKAVHMKNMAVQNYADGFLLSEVLFEDGFLDIPAMWALVKKANPAIKPVHELITRDPLKVPVLTDQYWATWPDRSGKYLADTIRLVNANASKKPLPTVSDLSREAQLQAEADNNVKCFDWARTALA